MEQLDITNPVHYTIANNPEGILKLFRKYNMPEPAPEEMLEAVRLLVIKNTPKAAYDLLEIHPDRGCILQSQPDYWKKYVSRYSGIASVFSSDVASNLNIRLIELKTKLANADDSDQEEINLDIDDIERELFVRKQNKNTLIFIAVIILIIWFSSGSPIKARSA